MHDAEYGTRRACWTANSRAAFPVLSLSWKNGSGMCLPRRSRVAAAHCENSADGSVKKRIGYGTAHDSRSEEHTSELQSQSNLVCRLLLEKKTKTTTDTS